MGLRDPKRWLVIVPLAAILWLIVRDLEKTSPGPLSTTHEREAQLGASEDCVRCHGEFNSDMRTACNVCHEEIEIQLTTQTGLHGAMQLAVASGVAEAIDPTECALCHLDHHGAGFPLVSAESFALAGWPDREKFDHAIVQFELAGRHTELACTECHANADAITLLAGQKRFLGQARDCATCHDDPHEGRMQPACEDCHGQTLPFSTVATFEHETTSLEGAHAQLECAECHAETGAYSVAVLASQERSLLGNTQRACAECHESPHPQAFEESDCSTCHAAAHESFAGRMEAMPRALHALASLDLEPLHDSVDCAACHVGETRSQRFPGRSPDDCAVCHEDPHEAQFAARACSECRGGSGFDTPAFGVAEHDLLAFPLTDSHRDVACSECHTKPTPDGARVFVGTAALCSDCHDDAHRGLLKTDSGSDCAACHRSTHFADVDASSFEHDQSTRFVLRGAHAEAQCETCHERTTSADEHGRRFGFAEAIAQGPIDRCESCHADPHAGRLRSTDVEAPGCATCHSEHSFRDASDSFAHDTWTAFKLEGAHARAECEACHTRAPAPDALGRTFGQAPLIATGSAGACAVCHVDPHFGAFDAPEKSAVGAAGGDCAQCHTNESFGDLVRPFDHAHFTGFPVSPEHSPLACVACHTPRGSTERRLGVAPGRLCQDCHTDPHAGQFAVRNENDCSRCHPDSGGLSFEHNRDSRFTLDEQHASLACSACHQPWELGDGRNVIRYRSLGVECADCHGPSYRSPGR